MNTIKSLKPNVSAEDAFSRLRGSALQELFGGSLRSLALVYVPFRLFRVDIQDRGLNDIWWMAQDCVTGTFDPYRFGGDISGEQLLRVVTRNHLMPSISPAVEADLLTTKVYRAIFSRGFFRIRKLEVNVCPLNSEFHVPYWAAFSGAGISARISVLDAVRGKLEGAKVRSVFTDWLAARR